MRIKLLLSGKTGPSYVKEGCELYEKRIKHYATFEIKYLAEIKLSKSMSNKHLRAAESEVFLKSVKPDNFVVLLDEKGKQFTSVEFSHFIEKSMVGIRNEIIFCIGGAYGFDELIKSRANEILSLSSLTFPHQLVRLIFLEQLYRSFTILKKEPYHHV